jgi:hypothetical protein
MTGEAPRAADPGCFEVAGRHEFTVRPDWRLPEIAGYIRSMSVLPAAELGERAAVFEADLAAGLAPYGTGGAYPQDVSFAYELARKPVTA